MTITRVRPAGEIQNGEISVQNFAEVIGTVGNMSWQQAADLMARLKEGEVTVVDPTPGDDVNEYNVALQSALQQRLAAVLRPSSEAISQGNVARNLFGPSAGVWPVSKKPTVAISSIRLALNTGIGNVVYSFDLSAKLTDGSTKTWHVPGNADADFESLKTDPLFLETVRQLRLNTGTRGFGRANRILKNHGI